MRDLSSRGRALGKTGNCQVGVSVHAVTDWASAAIDWRLFLPQSWDDDTISDPDTAAEIRGRRSRSKIPMTPAMTGMCRP